MVVVVFAPGVERAVDAGVGGANVSAGVGVGESPVRLSCARAAEAAKTTAQKMMAGRLIDRLNTNAINRS